MSNKSDKKKGTAVWPNWYPGKSLKAIDLIGLEHHIASRFSYPTDGFGVIELDEDNLNAELNKDGSHISIHASDIKGITKRGQLVKIGRPGKEVVVPAQRQRTMLIDLEVSIDRTTEDSDNNEKFVLVASTSENKNEFYQHNEDTLYLGRYSCTVSDGDAMGRVVDFSLLNRPPLFTLSGVNAGTKDLMNFVLPFSNKINNLIEKKLQRRQLKEFPHAQSVALSESYFIAYHWPTLPVTVLVQRLKYLNWLVEALDKELKIDASASASFSRQGIDLLNDVDSLPKELAKLLGRESDQDGFKDTLKSPHQYVAKWAPDGGNTHLEITLNDRFEASVFQIVLDYTGLPKNSPDCPETVGSRVERKNGKYVAAPELRRSKESEGRFLYQLTLTKDLDENSKIILYSVSAVEPKVYIRNYN